jgi:hypothetical protein
VPIDYGRLRNVTAREIFLPSTATASCGTVPTALTRSIYNPYGRTVTVVMHGRGSTFTRKTLKSMIKQEARWTEEDLKRLKLIR